MQYFTENKHDIEGYVKNIKKLEKLLDRKTHQFMLQHSFHDSQINKLIVLNHEEKEKGLEKSPVSVQMQLTHWEGINYELMWQDVQVFKFDFDIARNKWADANDILFERGLDQWSRDELTQVKQEVLRHEIHLFSQTRISIECQKFSIKKIISEESNLTG